jgi:hypothetical protein
MKLVRTKEITLNTALLTKEKGYDQNPFLTVKSYDNNGELQHSMIDIKQNIVVAPLQSDLHNWLMENFGIYVTIEVDQTMEPKFCYSIYQYKFDKKGYNEWRNLLHPRVYSDLYYTYAEALEKGLEEALNNI